MKTRRIISMLVALCMLMSVLAVPSYSVNDEIEYEGELGDNLTWYFDEQTNTLEIYGAGEMEGLLTRNMPLPWSEFRKQIEHIKLSHGITSIGQYIFRNLPNLTSFIIPDSIKKIDSFAFYGCENLSYVYIPNSVQELDSLIFSGCTSLKNCGYYKDGEYNIEYEWSEYIPEKAFYGAPINQIEFPETIQEIGQYAFSSSDVTTVDIPGTISVINEGTFSNCDSLRIVNIPSSITTIGCNAFSGCGNLKSVTIPTSVTTIGFGAFERCCSLQHIDIPDSVTSISDAVFRSCDNLESANLSNNITYMGFDLFRETAIKEIYIPEKVNYINENSNGPTFYECKSLNNIFVDSNNTHFCNDNFGVLYNYERTALLQYPIANQRQIYNLSDTTSIIKFQSFYNADYLTEVHIPKSVVTIEGQAFFDCDNIQKIFFYGDVPSVWGKKVFAKSNLEQLTIYYLENNTSGWTSPTWTAPDGLIYNTVPFSLNDESEQNAPTISGIQDNYTLTLGESLTLDGTITAGRDGKLTAVSLKHNEVDSAFDHRRVELDDTTFSPAEFGELTTDAYPLNEVGTYEFCIYAAATNYTVTNNLVATFTVTVVDAICYHTNASVVVKQECQNKTYTSYDITGHSYTYYPHQTRECLTCHMLYNKNGALVTVTDEPHSENIILDHGFMCQCGYLSITSDHFKTAYLNSSKAQEPVYITYENYAAKSNTDRSYVFSSDVIEVICSYKECYFVRYSISGSQTTSYKYRFINKELISFDEIDIPPTDIIPDYEGTGYSICTADKNYVESIEKHYGDGYEDFHIISDVTGKIRIQIFDEINQKFLTEAELNNNFFLTWNPINNDDEREEIQCPYFYDPLTKTFDVIVQDTGIIKLENKDGEIIDNLNIYYSTHIDRIQPLKRYIPVGIKDPRLNGAWNYSENLIFDWNDVTYVEKYDGYHIDLTFYNHQGNYFVLTTYNAKQEMQQQYLISPYKVDIDAWNAVGKLAEVAYDLTVGVIKGDFINGKTPSVSEVTNLKITVPAGGYFIIEDSHTSDLAQCLDIFTLMSYYLQMSMDAIDAVTLKGDLDNITPEELLDCFSSKEALMKKIAETLRKEIIGNDEISGTKNSIEKINKVIELCSTDVNIVDFLTTTFESLCKGVGNVENIGAGAFYACWNLNELTVDPNNPYYASVDGVLFNKNKTELHTYLPAKSDKNYVVPNSVVNIGNFAFYGCDTLISVTLPDELRSIGQNAFSNCQDMTSITIPKNVSIIGDEAFESCSKLKMAIFEGDIPTGRNWGWDIFEWVSSKFLLL